MPKSKRDKKGGRKGRWDPGGISAVWVSAAMRAMELWGHRMGLLGLPKELCALAAAGCSGQEEHPRVLEPRWGKGAETGLSSLESSSKVCRAGKQPLSPHTAPDLALAHLFHLSPSPLTFRAVAILAAAPFLQHRLTLVFGSCTCSSCCLACLRSDLHVVLSHLSVHIGVS